MIKRRLKGSMKTFANHIDPDKEEHLKWMNIEIDNNVKKIIKLVKSINGSGNRDGNLKKKSEIVHLVEDFHHHYESLYSLYEDLRGEVKNKINGGDDDNNSLSSSDSESYYSPKELSTPKSNDTSSEILDIDDLENTILKDKLTSSIEVKETMNLSSQSRELDVALKDLRVHDEELDKINRTKELEEQAASMKIEIEMLFAQKLRLKEKIERRSNEAIQLLEKISRLEAKENEFQSSIQKLEEDEKGYLSRISDLASQANNLQLELVSMKSQKDEMESEIKKKSDEIIEILRNGDRGVIEANDETLKVRVKDLELEVGSLSIINRELEDKITKITQKAEQLEVENCEIRGKISELGTKPRDLENALETLQNERNSLRTELESVWNDKKRHNLQFDKEKQDFLQLKSQMEKKNADLSNKISDLTVEIESLQTEKKQLNSKNAELLKNLLEAENKLQDSRSKDIQIVEKRIEETAEEFRKQYEGKYKILSRRIRVAEQLHVETKEWYLKTRGDIEQENKDLKEKLENSEYGFKNVKDITLTANDVLVSLDSVGLRFEECTANFLNRISKASCELKFVKDWAMRKNKALVHVKDDLDCLLSQLDDKEGELLVFREKVWKSENKVRELEKLVKEKDDLMMALKEEKREAIRQLCVWIDYHRSRSDYYKKMIVVSQINSGRRSAS